MSNLRWTFLIAATATLLGACARDYGIKTVLENRPGIGKGDPFKPANDPTGDIAGDDDVDPTPTPDPDGETEVTYPFRGNYATITYEDLFPNPGDADYNDFVMNFKIGEFFNDKNQLTKITVDFTPRHLGAGYDHSLLLVLDGKKDAPSNITLESTPLFNGAAGVEIVFFNAAGGEIRRKTFNSAEDIVLIESTKTRDWASAKMTAIIAEPNRNQVPGIGPVDIAKYRVVLHVKNTNQDIDLVTVNPDVVYSNDFPFGLIVPIEWKWPTERTHIDGPYEHFKEYRAWLKGGRTGNISPEGLKWFNFVAPGKESLVESD